MRSLFIIMIVATAMAATSCDDRFDFLNKLNQPPSIQLSHGSDLLSTSFSDSLKTSLKNGSKFYEASFVVKDPENLLGNLTYSVELGADSVLQNGKKVSQIAFDQSGKAVVDIYPQAQELNKLKFTVTDNLGNKGIFDLALLSFINLPPVASIDITKVGITNAYEYDLDGSKSVDQDKNQGGKVVQWEWTINGTSFISNSSISRFIFPGTGSYEIKLRAIDNDGTYSQQVSKILTL